MSKKKVYLGILYWIWSLTWGGLMTYIGLIVTFALHFVKLIGKIFNKNLAIKTHINGWSIITEVGGNWGGLELGAVALCGY